MTRVQVLHRQILAGIVVLLTILAILGVRSFLSSFGHQVPLGTLTEATLGSSSGALPTWKDPAILAEINGALARYQVGPGFAAHEHGHASITLVLVDDQGRQVSLGLPVGESVLVTISARPGIPKGNSWPMPRLLSVLAKYALPELQAKHMDVPVLEYQLQHWRDTFGKGG